MKRKDIIKELQALDPEEHVAITEWSASDVLNQAEQDDVELTQQEANNIIDSIHKECAGAPIDWDTISDAITEWSEEASEKKELCLECNEEHAPLGDCSAHDARMKNGTAN
jgi:hypothetical protein